MGKILDQPRYKCALAAMQTVHSIPRAIPILHSGPGCGMKLNDNIGTSGRFSPNIFPCTSISEKEVVFGGDEKLRTTVENALKVIDADLFVILTGCTSEIIGDDVAEVARSFAGSEKPVIFVNTPGFKGNNYVGHDWILTAIFDQYLKSPDSGHRTQKGLVNIFAGVPMQDPFWLGNLRALERLVADLGLTPNTIFGHGRGLDNLRLVPEAEFNLLVSPWCGIESVQFLEKKYGTPYLQYPTLPIGAFESSKFLRAVGEYAGVDPSLVERTIREHEAEYYYYIERFADVILETRIMSKRFVAVCDSQYSLAITKFFVNDLGLFPLKQYITDDAPATYRSAIESEFRSLNYGIKADVEFSTDGYAIHKEIAGADFGGTPFIVGSAWEKPLAAKLGGQFVNVTYPVVERLVMNGSIAGYDGGLKLLEDIYSEALSRLSL